MTGKNHNKRTKELKLRRKRMNNPTYFWKIFWTAPDGRTYGGYSKIREK